MLYPPAVRLHCLIMRAERLWIDMSLVLTLVIGYLLGSINFSIIFTQIFAKTDVREHGSGNAGFTNTLRTAGKKAAVIVFVCDALKAVVAILIAVLINRFIPFDPFTQYGKYTAALGVVLGHNFPVYYGFKGGKGIVVSIAILFSINWITACFVLGVFLILFFATGFVSLGSVAGAVTVIVCTSVMYALNLAGVDAAQLALMFALGFLAIYMHRTNIKRLLDGTESSFKKKR